jgi:hypothetical protein
MIANEQGGKRRDTQPLQEHQQLGGRTSAAGEKPHGLTARTRSSANGIHLEKQQGTHSSSQAIPDGPWGAGSKGTSSSSAPHHTYRLQKENRPPNNHHPNKLHNHSHAYDASVVQRASAHTALEPAGPDSSHAPLAVAWCEIICGPMFAGKSTALLKRVAEERLAGKRAPAPWRWAGLEGNG